MKMLITSIGREFKLIFRNGISIFMVAAPAILAFVFILVFGAVNETTLQLAVDETVSPQVQSQLEKIADVERFDDPPHEAAHPRDRRVVGVRRRGGSGVLLKATRVIRFISGTSE